MDRHKRLSPDEVSTLNAICEHMRAARQALSEAARVAIQSRAFTPEDLVRILSAIDAVNVYGMTPQSEWLGGDSSEPKNFCIRPPHALRD